MLLKRRYGLVWLRVLNPMKGIERLGVVVNRGILASTNHCGPSCFFQLDNRHGQVSYRIVLGWWFNRQAWCNRRINGVVLWLRIVHVRLCLWSRLWLDRNDRMLGLFCCWVLSFSKVLEVGFCRGFIYYSFVWILNLNWMIIEW